MLVSNPERFVIIPNIDEGAKFVIAHEAKENISPKETSAITSNGKHVISPSSGFNAMREVEVDVNVTMTTIYEELTPYGFPSDIAKTLNANMLEWLENTKKFVKDDMSEEEVQELKNKVLAFKDISVDVSDGNLKGSTLSNCTNLISVGNVTLKDSLKCNKLFSNCTNLISVGNISTTYSASYLFELCSNLQRIGILDWSFMTSSPTGTFNECSNLIDIGGINNLQVNVTIPSSKLSPQSVFNLMSKAIKPSKARTLTLHATAKANFLAECEVNPEYMLIFDEFVNVKGWTLA